MQKVVMMIKWSNEKESVRAAEGNRGPNIISFAKQFELQIRTELGEANYLYHTFYI